MFKLCKTLQHFPSSYALRLQSALVLKCSLKFVPTADSEYIISINLSEGDKFTALYHD